MVVLKIADQQMQRLLRMKFSLELFASHDVFHIIPRQIFLLHALHQYDIQSKPVIIIQAMVILHRYQDNNQILLHVMHPFRFHLEI